MTKIYFVRHAESYGNLARRAYGHFDGLVTPKGYEQIECLKKRFAGVQIDAVYSSDLKRTVETAKAISEPRGLDVITTPKLREVSLGVWEDMPWGEIPRHYPEQFENWIEKPRLFRVENGESYEKAYNRMMEALSEIVSDNEGKTVAVVSHGAALRALMNGLENGGELKELEKSSWGDNTCVSLFEYENGRYTAVFKNDNSHLKNMPGFADNMKWVGEDKKSRRNIYFEIASLPEDAEKIRRYYSLAWREVFGDELSDMRAVERKVRGALRRDKNAVAFGIGPGGEVGMVVYDAGDRVCKDAGHISCVYLKQEYRGMGYGIQLIGHAISNYARMGKKFVSVRVSEKNIPAYNFYKKYGFYESHREQDGDTVQIVMLLGIA